MYQWGTGRTGHVKGTNHTSRSAALGKHWTLPRSQATTSPRPKEINQQVMRINPQNRMWYEEGHDSRVGKRGLRWAGHSPEHSWDSACAPRPLSHIPQEKRQEAMSAVRKRVGETH